MKSGQLIEEPFLYVAGCWVNGTENRVKNVSRITPSRSGESSNESVGFPLTQIEILSTTLRVTCLFRDRTGDGSRVGVTG